MKNIERLVHHVLLWGLALSAALLLGGLIVWAFRGGELPTTITMPPASFADLARAQPIGFFSTGLFVLVLTPFARVAGSIVLFAKAGDRRYTAITAVVLLVMAAGLLLGRV